MNRKSNAEYQAERDRCIKILMASKWWTRKETFKAADFAQISKNKTAWCADTLNWMADRRMVDRKKDNLGNFTYRRPAIDLIRIDWRIDHQVYDLVQQEMRAHQ